MTVELPDLFPGFPEHRINTQLGELYCRTGGKGPPLLLIHGYPQTHVMWHRVSPTLAEHFRLIAVDLPGYGFSEIPALTDNHGNYSKRATAAALTELMSALGHEKFAVAGHDRGGRVAYRMALDHPERVGSLAVLDILPTVEYWNKLDRVFGLSIYHWMFLAQPAPFPERLIARDAVGYLRHTLASWTAEKSLAAFSDGALSHYEAFFSAQERIAATCEDYRAGAGLDVEHDLQTQRDGIKISAPTLALWGEAGIASKVSSHLDTWASWADCVSGTGLRGGHFIAEEAPAATSNELLRFFRHHTG
ncbi:haloacetate dehalogenase [Roseibium hamelinense]|uniref:Haloacetate dehalogenase n=1 Tax=Roseibium hamelinense TaxID=150831 RepID=A0A562T2R3_9HYPH|nr:alpha/beta hydrolase [Roseibium hamelinense]MTI42965.1 alpha/beta hydrolase [Roseibium hamelinense]TWI87598.1 haloacetate dehalogenase [Roseibium hamelinense]